MRVLLQRVARASVSVDEKVVGRINRGFCLLVGITHDDTQDEAQWLANKICGLRLFEDQDGKLNRSLAEVGGAILAVSQFTLYGDTRKGRRPSFTDAARPEHAEPLFDYFVDQLRERNFHVETGVFGAAMQVTIVNDGPVTLMIERNGAA